MPDRIRVLVADESRTVRLLLTSLLRDDDRFEVVGEVASGAAVMTHLDSVDLVVLNVVLEDGDGFSVLDDVLTVAPQLATAIVAAVDPPYLRAEAASRGAGAFFTHSMDPVELLDGLAAVTQAAR